MQGDTDYFEAASQDAPSSGFTRQMASVYVGQNATKNNDHDIPIAVWVFPRRDHSKIKHNGGTMTYT